MRTQRQNRRFRPVSIGVAVAVAAAGLVAGGSPAIAAPGDQTCAWADRTKSATERARLLLAASSLPQKERWLNEQAANSPKQTSFTARGGKVTTYPVQVDCTPTVVYTDGPDGIRGVSGVTAFPSQIALGATFNASLAYDKGAAQGREGFEKGKNGVLGPGISSGRTPLAGRTPEYFGEDSLLSGTQAGEQIAGIQSNPGVMADLKHYVANEQELDRQTSSSNLDERTFHEIYQLPFAIATADTAAASIMCSYNQINGVYACENPLLTSGLRGELDYKGYVVSDFGAVHSTAASLKAGLDQELNAPIYFTPDLLQQALDAGAITAADIDQAAFRVVRAYIAAGVFDTPLPATPTADASSAAHKALARQIAEQGAVLLKNASSALPLTPKRKQTIAVIGATASNDATDGISAKSVCSMYNSFGGRGSNSLTCEDVVAPLDSIRDRAARSGASVTFDPGTDPATAGTAAADADVAIVFAHQRSGEFVDLPDLRLPGNQDAVISAVAAKNRRTIVVLETGSAVEMPWLAKVKSVVEAWYPGEQQGPALARLLFGDTDFSGRLPMTFPKSLADVPTSTPAQYPGIVDSKKIRQVSYSEKLAVGYKWYQSQHIKPLFPFGHGLSYTKFKYSKLKVVTSKFYGRTRAKVTVTVRNSGRTTGTVVPQVYLTLPKSAADPGSRLTGYKSVTLKAGRSAKVTFTIDSTGSGRPFSVWSPSAHQWRTPSGKYQLSLQDDAESVLARTSFMVR